MILDYGIPLVILIGAFWIVYVLIEIQRNYKAEEKEDTEEKSKEGLDW